MSVPVTRSARPLRGHSNTNCRPASRENWMIREVHVSATASAAGRALITGETAGRAETTGPGADAQPEAARTRHNRGRRMVGRGGRCPDGSARWNRSGRNRKLDLGSVEYTTAAPAARGSARGPPRDVHHAGSTRGIESNRYLSRRPRMPACAAVKMRLRSCVVRAADWALPVECHCLLSGRESTGYTLQWPARRPSCALTSWRQTL
jgi:hypothetical protein